MNPFLNWGPAEVAAHNSRVRKENRIPVPEDAVERERDLHYQIIEECKRKCWIAFHGSMAHKTKRTLGEADFCCLIDNGIVLFVECKKPGQKLSTDQNATRAWMRKLGHEMHVVHSLREFVEVCEASLRGILLGGCASASENTELIK